YGNTASLGHNGLRHTFGRMFSDGMCNLMSHYRSQSGLGFSYRQNTAIHSDLTARHTPCINLVLLDEIEFPLEIVLVSITILLQETVYRIGNVLTNALYHLGLARAFDNLCFRITQEILVNQRGLLLDFGLINQV